MAEGFQETEEFAAYSAEDRAIISAFIEAQTAAGEGVPLSSTDEIEITYVDEPLVLPEPVIDPKSHTLIIFPDDANVLLPFGDTWSLIKTDAMAFGYFEQPTIKVLPNFEEAVVRAHQQAQFETGDPAGALDSRPATEITWVDDESPIVRYFD